MLYVLNSLITPVDFQNKVGYVVSFWKIDLETARRIIKEMPFVSAVGHETTARVLTELLEVEIPHNRIAVRMKEGDAGLHFVLRTRLPEGKVLSEEELRQLDFDLVLSRVS
jgi:predicted membrane GTPase involved in stress response